MKLIILSVTMALVSAGRLENTYLPPTQTGPGSQIPILKLQNDNNGDGTYRFSFETANRIVQQESGQPKSAASSAVQGSYSYVGPDGQTYTVNYIADENGFRAEGAHLPTPPPIPDLILKSLQDNAAEEAAGIVLEGQYRAASRGSGQYGGSPPTSQYLPPKRY